jgi:hypothetical protein
MTRRLLAGGCRGFLCSSLCLQKERSIPVNQKVHIGIDVTALTEAVAATDRQIE